MALVVAAVLPSAFAAQARLKHDPGCRSKACDVRVDRWWGRHHHLAGPQARVAGVEGVASWYEDGGSTACGTHATLGVANKTLPCGTRVRICHEGCEVATVDDRGPFVAGREWDLNAAAKAAISCPDLCDVRASVVR